MLLLFLSLRTMISESYLTVDRERKTVTVVLFSFLKAVKRTLWPKQVKYRPFERPVILCDDDGVAVLYNNGTKLWENVSRVVGFVHFRVNTTPRIGDRQLSWSRRRTEQVVETSAPTQVTRMETREDSLHRIKFEGNRIFVKTENKKKIQFILGRRPYRLRMAVWYRQRNLFLWQRYKV